MRPLIIIVVVGILCACVTPIASNPSSGSRLNSPASGAASGARTSSPSSSPSVADCPASITNISGSYMLQCPAGWMYVNCESNDVHGAFTWLINPTGCSAATNSARMIVWGVPGQVSGEDAGSGMYVGTRKSSKNVSIEGISGTRRTYLVAKSVASAPPKGTVQILYTFVTNGETHFALYNRYPKEPDLTAEFDRMITATLTFLP